MQIVQVREEWKPQKLMRKNEIESILFKQAVSDLEKCVWYV